MIFSLRSAVAAGVCGIAVAAIGAGPAFAAESDSSLEFTAAGTARADGYVVPFRVSCVRDDLVLTNTTNVNLVGPQARVTLPTWVTGADGDVTYTVRFANPNPAFATQIAAVNTLAAANDGNSITSFESDINPILVGATIPAGTTATIELTGWSNEVASGDIQFQLFTDGTFTTPASPLRTIGAEVTRPALTLNGADPAAMEAGGAVPDLSVNIVDDGILPDDSPSPDFPERVEVSIDGATPIPIGDLESTVAALAPGVYELTYTYAESCPGVTDTFDVTALPVTRELTVNAAPTSTSTPTTTTPTSTTPTSTSTSTTTVPDATTTDPATTVAVTLPATGVSSPRTGSLAALFAVLAGSGFLAAARRRPTG